MLETIIVIVVAVIAIVLGIATLKPNAFRVQRSIDVNAPPETIQPLITDFRRWAAWSPYERLDPAMAKNYGGAPSGVGAVYEWNGKKAGAGRMEILDATPAKVTIKLDFTKPMPAHNTAEFLFEPAGTGTAVTWAIFGPTPFMTKVFTTFVSMDKLVGKDFETGLASLKRLAEQ